MASNVQKTPLAPSLSAFAEQKILDAIRQFGKALPCTVTAVQGQIVTVSFDVNAAPWTLPSVTMPLATSIYDWLPIQVGAQGYAATADAYLGGVSGLGGGTADLTHRGNLSALVFTPVSNTAWTAPGGDGNMRVTQGPDGVLIQDMGGAVIGRFSKTAGIALSFGGLSLTMSGGAIAIVGNLTVTGDVTAGQSGTYTTLQHHAHTGVSSGSDDSGPPVGNT